jgi:ankyrin repeat protein
MSLRSCVIAAAAMGGFVVSAHGAESAQAPIFEAIGKLDALAVRRILEHDPGQARLRDARGLSPLTRALFASRGDGFIAPKQNEMVSALLARSPTRDFFETCALGSAAEVETMLQADPKLVTSWHPFGWTPLHFAGFGGNVAAVDVLLAHGASVNERARNRFRNQPLAASLLTGQLEAAKRLIEGGADVNSRQSGGAAPIHEAALLGRRDLIDLLLENGAEIGARANDGRNAVSEAERGKHPQIATYLRTRGGTDPRITANLSAEPTD